MNREQGQDDSPHMMRTKHRRARAHVRRRRNVLCLLACLLVLGINGTAQRRASFQNPAVAGDYPDPSVTRVGRDFWAATTSSEWGPEFPLLHSRDLVNWELVGTVFRHPPAWASGSFWAPEISQDRGRFLIYYAARKKNGPMCVAVATAAQPAGPYTDHGPVVCQDVGSIDPFPATDENGRRYLLWKEDGNSVSKPTPIWAQPLSADGTRLVGERRELIHNTQAWEKHPTLPYGDLVEGPSVVRRNGWFYLFYSGNFCCGRECNYALGVARARHLLGPWEKNPANPILASNAYWKCPGHGTVINDWRGRYFLMYHAYSVLDSVYVGRQALIDEVVWPTEEGWPTINDGRGPSWRNVSPFGAIDRNTEYSFFDNFTAPQLRPGWQWPQANEPLVRIDPARRGWLVLAPTAAHATDPLGAVLARSTPPGDYWATTIVDTSTLKHGAVAGLVAYGDGENALGISVGDGHVTLWRREKNESHTVASIDAPRVSLLRLFMMVSDGHRYRFAVSADDHLINVGDELDGSYLPPWDRGVRVALVAGGARGMTARFGWLSVGKPQVRMLM